MTRQPALENRITVAWPMPRLAPVSSKVRRGVLAVLGMGVLKVSMSRIKPRLAPWLVRCPAAKFDAVVQAERPVMPEFKTSRHDPPTAPARRSRHLADDVF